MKWLVATLLVINAGMFLWATGHRPDSAESFARNAVNPANMRLLGEVGGDPSREAMCYRVGPFYDPNTVALASQKLGLLGIPYSQRAVKEREIRAYRVYLGPFNDDEALESERQRLRQSNVSDHHVRRDQREGTVISLGLFSQRDAAQALVRELARKEMSARAREEKRVLGPTFWLELEDEKANDRARDGLRNAKWGDPRARLRRSPCSRPAT